jgi:UDPglucose 6-dehydrogenase
VNITIVGAGYVGLVTAAGFAEMGNKVTCVESDPKKLRMLESGVVPIHEPGLEALLQSNARAGRLSFTSSLAQAAGESELFLIAVGTPPLDDGSPDMSYVYGVADEIGRTIDRYSIVATKSTVPVGTADRVRKIIDEALRARGTSVEFDVASNPEFLKEGAAVRDFMTPERIIIGCDSERAASVLRRLYAPFTRSYDRILAMRPREAEMTKYASNALLATKISFMNEIAEFCDALDVDVEKVRAGVGADSRIGYSFLYAGCGYGGSCFPKDIKALIHTAKQSAHRLGYSKQSSSGTNGRSGASMTKLSGGMVLISRAGHSRSGALRSSLTLTTCAKRRLSPLSSSCCTQAPGCGPMTPSPGRTWLSF